MTTTSGKDDDIIIMEPDPILRELIGKDTKLAEIFTKERIEKSQGVIEQARGTFFDVALEELAKLETLIKKQSPDGQTPVSDTSLEDIAAEAANLRGHAELFGFTLISSISGHIIEHGEPRRHTPAARFQLIADLVKLLRIAIRQKITDDRGMLARELNASLKKF